MKTIAIRFPEVKLNLDINDLNFDTLENTVFDITQALGRKAIEKALFDIDDILKEERPKRALENTGKREKYFLTRLGDIRYKRRRYIDKTTGKPRYLLEERLGIKKNQRISLSRAKIEMYIASVSPYREVKKVCKLLMGYERSHEGIRQSVIREAERIIVHQEDSIERIKRLEDKEEDVQGGNKIAYMETDSAYIRLQRRRKRKKRVYKIKTKGRRRKRKSIEVKLAIGYRDKVRRYKSGRGKSLRLKDKFTYTGIVDGKKFMEDLSVIAEKRLSLSKAKAIIFGGDGGSYITAGIRDYFVGAIYILSKFHLKRNIKRSLCSRPNTQPIINELLRKDKIDKALSLITGIMQRTKDRKEKESLKELHRYIEQNREGINPIKQIKDKAIREEVKGSGAMESNVDKFLAHRFKKRGMSWSVRGSLSLLKVKEAIINGEWDTWWLERRDEKIAINTEPLKQLTAKQLWKKSESSLPPLIEAAIPALKGPDQNEPWVKVLRELQSIDYYK